MKKLIASIIAASMLLITPMATTAKMESVAKDVIVMHSKVYMSDYIEFIKATSDPSIKHYTILIHSPGGNAVTTMAIMNRIIEMKKAGIKFTTKIHGVGMSAGSYIFLMGDERITYEGSALMWHTMSAQWAEWQREQIQKEHPQVYNTLKRIDDYVRARFAEVSGMSATSCAYWLDGGKAQYMSGLTAYNVGIATQYIRVK